MAEYLIQDTTLDAIADAINAKTGGSSAMTPAEMATAIGNIPTGGGLPQYITKISSGTFTFASNTVLTTHIPHDLGVTPKFVLCWTDDLEARNSGNGLLTGSLIAQTMYKNETQFYEAFRGAEVRLSANEIENISSLISNLSDVLGPDYFCFYHGGRYYNTGATYKWIAIA